MQAGIRVLVANQDTALMRELSAALSSEGHEVLQAFSGSEALEEFRRKRPEVVVLDARFSAPGGTDLCHQIKAEAPGSFVVLITTDPQPADARPAMADAAVPRSLGPRGVTLRVRAVLWHLLARNVEGGGAGPVVESTARPEEVSFQDPKTHGAGVIAAVLDLTGQSRIEEQFRVFAYAVESAREFITITDEQDRFTYANQAFLEAYGYRIEEVLGKTPNILRSAQNPPGIGEEVYTHTLAGHWSGELINRRKDGSEFPIYLSTSVIRNNAGKTLGLIGVSRDISEEKRAAKQTATFSELHNRLSAAVTSEAAAQIILEIASELLGWDAGYVHLYSQGDDQVIPLATQDTIDGVRKPVPTSTTMLEPTPLGRLVITEGAQLIGSEKDGPPPVPFAPFGNLERRSACKMYAPIRSAGMPIGVISIQSYLPGIYSRKDLDLLQMLADECGDALKRIEAQAKYRSIFEKATEGIFQTTPAGRYRSANPAMARLLGYSSPEELISSITDLAAQVYVDPRKRDELMLLLEREGVVENFETEAYRRDGTKIWVKLSVHLVHDADGHIRYYEGTIRDVTERKWAEHLLRVQRDFGVFLSSTNDLTAAVERLLSSALEAEGVDCGAIYLVDSQTGDMDLFAHRGFSSGFARRAGHVPAGTSPRGESTDQNGLANRQAPAPMERILRVLRREDLLDLELVPIQHKGHVVVVVTVGSHSHQEIPTQTCRLLEAIAAQAGGAIARIRAEELMRSSKELHERTLQGVRAAIFVVDFQTNTILEANPAATRIFGYSREEMVGRSARMLHTDEAGYQTFKRCVETAFKERGRLDDFQSTMKRRDGTIFPSEHTVVPTRSDSGDTVSWVSVVRDITKQKRTEEELHLLSRQLIEAQEVERMRVARELHDGVNQMLASAKMRLRNVLARGEALRPAAREILARCGQLLVEALEENRRIAHNLRPGDLDVLGFATACRNFCKDIETRTGLRITCRISKQLQRLPSALELNLFRIVQETIHNATKHAKATKLTLAITVQGKSLVLRIKDNGQGFDPEATRPGKGQGRGLGLSNIRARAVSCGGTCDIESAAGHGTTVVVRVPGAEMQ